MPSIDVPGARLEADVHGSGPSVVQLHGLTSSRRGNAEGGLDLTGLLREHTVVRYDARGHGASTGRTVPEDYVWPRLAEDLLQLLDRLLPGERVHGIGPSMGTGTLLHAALLDPSRFLSLTLTIPPTAWETRPDQSLAYLAGADLIETHGLEAFVRMGRLAARPPALVDQEVQEPQVRAELLPSVLRGAARSDLPDPGLLAGIRVPTLVLAWPGDASHPLSTARGLHEAIPGSRLRQAHTPDELATWPRLVAEHIG